jgi:hypothetical protein
LQQDEQEDDRMKLLMIAALALIALWAIFWAAMQVTGMLVHVLLLAGLALIAYVALRRGFRRTRARVAAVRHGRGDAPPMH